MKQALGLQGGLAISAAPCPGSWDRAPCGGVALSVQTLALCGGTVVSRRRAAGHRKQEQARAIQLGS